MQEQVQDLLTEAPSPLERADEPSPDEPAEAPEAEPEAEESPEEPVSVALASPVAENETEAPAEVLETVEAPVKAPAARKLSALKKLAAKKVTYEVVDTNKASASGAGL